VSRRSSPARRPLGLLLTAVAAASLALAASGCGGSSKTSASSEPSLFTYDAAQPLAYRDLGRVNRDYPIAIHDVSYASRGGRIQGFLAVPPGHDRLPAVIYVHGAGGDRTSLLVPAAWLAARGAIVLAITAPSRTSAPPTRNLKPIDFLRRQAALTASDVVAVRRAVDVLSRLPRVDPKKIGYTGFSAGARMGAIAAGVEPRLRAAVLMSGGSDPVSAYVSRVPRGLKADVRRILSQIDPLRYIGRARPGTLLLLDGRRDTIVPRAALVGLARAAPPATTVRWYAAGHSLNNAAWRDQLAWLSRRLDIRGPRVPGAKAGP
jgi:dienelactone hydrolase